MHCSWSSRLHGSRPNGSAGQGHAVPGQPVQALVEVADATRIKVHGRDGAGAAEGVEARRGGLVRRRGVPRVLQWDAVEGDGGACRGRLGRAPKGHGGLRNHVALILLHLAPSFRLGSLGARVLGYLGVRLDGRWQALGMPRLSLAATARASLVVGGIVLAHRHGRIVEAGRQVRRDGKVGGSGHGG